MFHDLLRNAEYGLIGLVAITAFVVATYAFVRLVAPLFRFFPGVHRVRYSAEPIPPDWPAIVDRNVPLVHRLGPEERERLLRLAQVFLRDIPIEGCNGLELTEEIRVTIAAGACLLLVNLRYPWLPTLKRVLVYPEAFAPERVPSRHDAGIQEEPQPTAGQAWQHGTVILSWRSVQADNTNTRDAHNVILHEFAHVLDGEDGALDGMPLLEPPSSARVWSRLLAEQFDRQQKLVFAGLEATLPAYGATNKAEFFAVATEVFFEQPRHLLEQAPELYEELRKFYRQDPALDRPDRS